MLPLRSDQKKTILTHDAYYSNYFLGKLTFLQFFALIHFEKSSQIPKSIEKTKDFST